MTSKPVVYLVNMSERDYVRRKNKWLAKIKQWIDQNSSIMNEDPKNTFFHPPLIPISIKLESEYSQLASPEEKSAYLQKMANLADAEAEKVEVKSVLPKIVTVGYQVLQLCYFFTAGADEVKAWTIRKGTKAPQAAGVM